MPDAISTVSALYTTLFFGCGISRYESHFTSPRIRCAPWLFAGVCILLRLVFTELVPTGEGSTPSAVRLVLLLATECACSVLMYGPGYKNALYPVLSWTAIFELSFFISYSIVLIFDPLYDYVANQSMPIALQDMGAFSRILHCIAFGVQTITLALLTTLQIVLCRPISECTGRSELTTPEFRLLSLPCAAGLLIAILLRILMVTVDDGIPGLIYDRYPSMRYLIPVICAVSLVSIVYAAKTRAGMREMEKAKRIGLVSEERLRALRSQIIETEKSNAQVRKVQHDLRNTLTVIHGLAKESPEGSALSTYIANLSNDIEALERPVHSGDPVADVLIAAKYRDLLDTAPETRFDADGLVLPDSIEISSYELGIILGNALDNAIEAVKTQDNGERFISLKSISHDDLLALYIENSFSNTALHRNTDGLPVSTKTSGHGIGLANIRDIAQKHGGTVDWRTKNGTFRLAVILKTGTI